MTSNAGASSAEELLSLTKRPRARPGTRQAEKADETRQQLLEAAVVCLTELGYANTTMTAIARKAGISRGAMQYHFESMQDVLRATVAYIHERRLMELSNHADDARRFPDDAERLARRVEAHWEFLQTPVGVAFFELSVAARTDDVLGEVIRVAHETFWEEWLRLTLEVFPEWQGRRKDLELACSLTQTLLEGLAFREVTQQEYAGLSEALRTYLSDRVFDIFRMGDLTPPK